MNKPFSISFFKYLVGLTTPAFKAEFPSDISEEVKIARDVHGVTDPFKRKSFAERVVNSRTSKGVTATVSKEEQDRIIAEMLDQQNKLLSSKSEPARPFNHSSKPLYVESRNDQLLAADVKQVGRVVTREVETRVDQSDFKRRVTLNYGGKCAITGHEVSQTLQAAHIAEFASDRNNNTSNGILLDVAFHIMFDSGLMAINPETMCVHFNCQHPLALLYSGKPIATPRVALDVEALTIRWNRFK